MQEKNDGNNKEEEKKTISACEIVCGALYLLIIYLAALNAGLL